MAKDTATPKTLRTLLDGLPGCEVQGDAGRAGDRGGLPFPGGRPGGLFVALKGAPHRRPPLSRRQPQPGRPGGGHRSRNWRRPRGSRWSGCPRPAWPWPIISAAFYDHPSRELTLVGITGTNGKTSTTYLLEAILTAAGCRVGVVGTVNYRVGDQTWPAPVTTPESLDLQRLLREMRTPRRQPRLPGGLLPRPGFKAGGRRRLRRRRSSPTSPRTTWIITGTWTTILPPNPGSFWNYWPTAAAPGGAGGPQPGRPPGA